MDEAQLNDLKQFIATTVSQATAITKTDLKEELERGLGSLHNELGSLHNEMNHRFDEVQAAIAETISTTNDATDEHLDNHEARLVKLEHQPAV